MINQFWIVLTTHHLAFFPERGLETLQRAWEIRCLCSLLGLRVLGLVVVLSLSLSLQVRWPLRRPGMPWRTPASASILACFLRFSSIVQYSTARCDEQIKDILMDNNERDSHFRQCSGGGNFGGFASGVTWSLWMQACLGVSMWIFVGVLAWTGCVPSLLRGINLKARNYYGRPYKGNCAVPVSSTSSCDSLIFTAHLKATVLGVFRYLHGMIR